MSANILPTSPALPHSPHALLVGFEISREKAIEWFSRSRNVKVNQLSKSEVANTVVHILRRARKKDIPVGATGEPPETYSDGSKMADTIHLILVSWWISLRGCEGVIPNVEDGHRERGYLALKAA